MQNRNLFRFFFVDRKSQAVDEGKATDYYTNDLVGRVLQMVKNASTGGGAGKQKTLDDIRREAIRGDERLLNMLEKDQQVRMNLKRSFCTIL